MPRIKGGEMVDKVMMIKALSFCLFPFLVICLLGWLFGFSEKVYVPFGLFFSVVIIFLTMERYRFIRLR